MTNIASGLGLTLLLSAALVACGPGAEKTEAANHLSPPAADSAAGTEPPAGAGRAVAKAEEVANMMSGLEETSSAPVKRYGIRSGKIEYSVEGFQSGTETIQWDEWGAREVGRSATQISAGTMKFDQNQLVITKPDFITTVDLASNTASRMANPLQELMAKTNAASAEALGKQMVQHMGGTMTGTDTVVGKTCEVWEIKDLGTTTCIWEGITLKLSADVMGMKMTKVATKFEEGGALDAAALEVPAGIAVTDAPNLGEIMSKMKDGAAPVGEMNPPNQ